MIGLGARTCVCVCVGGGGGGGVAEVIGWGRATGLFFLGGGGAQVKSMRDTLLWTLFHLLAQILK